MLISGKDSTSFKQEPPEMELEEERSGGDGGKIVAGNGMCIRWHCLYHVFTYIYSLLIEKDTCDCQNL